LVGAVTAPPLLDGDEPPVCWECVEDVDGGSKVLVGAVVTGMREGFGLEMKNGER
jgi:hypothetical protein